MDVLDDMPAGRLPGRGRADAAASATIFEGAPQTHRDFTGTRHRVTDGRVAEAWEVYDEMGMWRQLGIRPT